ncbi:MAG: flagellar basal body rod protein FlgC [Myxococcales bacterium]|nr:flagellar basal body rod protein FlgC [Myxococcales bacterium]
MEIASSGLDAQRARMNALASNLANARTTRTAEGGPYKRIDPVFQAVPVNTDNRFADAVANAAGAEPTAVYRVEVSELRRDQAPPQQMYDPSHPDADERGFVALPNVNAVEEMVNLITASRAYESGVTVMQTIKGMAQSALSIGS